jgi:hypothetical protein
VTSLGTGAYTVRFPGLSALGCGNVQVSAYGSGGEYCKIVSWVGENVGVQCYSGSGSKAETHFVATYTSHFADGFGSWGAYLWNDRPAEATNKSYTPSPACAWNSANGSTKVTRTGTGTYKVVINGQTDQATAQPIINAGQTAQGPTALVTAYGTGSEFCQAGDITGNSSSTTVNVTCWKTPSNPVKANAQFSLVMGSKRLFFSSAQGYMHNACNGAPKSANLYIDDLPGSAAMQTDRIGTGIYQLYFPGLVSYGSSVAIVTAHGTSARRCSVASWGDAPMGGTSVEVRCYDKGNRLADSRCNIAYGTSQGKPLLGIRM